MADITKIRLTKGSKSQEYNIRDDTARNAAARAQSAATQAKSEAADALSAANTAQDDIDALIYTIASVEDITLILTEKTGV